MPSVGETIRDLRRARGWTQLRLAEEFNRASSGNYIVTADEIKRWERGRRTPRPEGRGYLATALGVPVEALDGALPDPLRRAHEWLVADSPQVIERRAGRRIGEHLAQQVEARVIELRHLDDHVGGEDLAPAVEQELRQTSHLVQESAYTEPVGKRLLVAVAELAQLAGWTASDAGKHIEAHRIYIFGVDAAEAAGDASAGANLLSSLSYQMSNNGKPQDALLLARSAVKGAPAASPLVRSLLLERVAWASARAADPQAATRALGAVEDAFSEVSPGTEEPEWTYWLNRDEVDTMAARVAVELGKPAEAASLLVPVLGRYPVESSRESSLYWSELATAYARAGELDGARDALKQAREFAGRVRSPRADARVNQVEALIP